MNAAVLTPSAFLALAAVAAALLSGCSTAARPQTAAGATPLGAPRSPVRPEIIDRVDPPGAAAPGLRLPDQITLPSTYRLLLIDGHLTLVRANEGAVVSSGPTSLRIVAGEIARGELAYQPALLPQELAAEVAANRESTTRMDRALTAVMQRSRELAAQAERLEAQTRALAAQLPAAAGGGPASPPGPAGLRPSGGAIAGSADGPGPGETAPAEK